MADPNIGQLLQDYGAGKTDSGLIDLLNRLHLPLTQDTINFIGYEQDMSLASGRTGLFNSWSLPAGADSRNDFFALDTVASQFAAASGWQYFPTPQQLLWGSTHGMAQMTTEQQWQWLASLNPKSTASMPWLQSGQTKEQWTANNQRLTDVWQQYTGNTNAPAALLQQAGAGQWSAQRFQEYIQNDPTLNAQYGWIKHGMTYDAFQQYKLNNKTQAAQRFGATAGDSQYLTMLDKPLTQTNMQSSAFQTTPQAPSSASTAGATSFGRSGEAR